MTLKDRLERVTKRMSPPESDLKQMNEDAAWVAKKLNDYAGRFEDAAASMTADDRRAAGFSVAMDKAWHIRFSAASAWPAMAGGSA